MVKIALKITVAIVAFLAWFGFALPYLISARSDELVATGYIVTIFGAVLAVVNIAKDVIAIQVERERR